jgi:hypothetical protein
MTATPCGVKHQHNTASIVVPLEVDVPSGSTLRCIVGCAGDGHDILTAQIGSTSEQMTGGDTGFFTAANQTERGFEIITSTDLSTGDTVTVTMEGAGQGFTTTMWAVLTYE